MSKFYNEASNKITKEGIKMLSNCTFDNLTVLGLGSDATYLALNKSFGSGGAKWLSKILAPKLKIILLGKHK